MKKKRSQAAEEPSGGSEWLATYSDMVTLLFTFFVLLFAISQVDVQKFNLLVISLANKGASPEQIMELGRQHELKNKEQIDVNDPKIPLSVGKDDDITKSMQDTYDKIQSHVDQSGIGDKVAVSHGDDYIFIRFVDDMLFEPNSARIRTQDFLLLDFVGKSLKSIQSEVGMIRIDGHTAAVPEQEDYPVSDRDLSSARANAVLKYFEDIVGVSGEKLTAFSYGKFNPIEPNETEAGRRRNRRIEILVTQTNTIGDQLNNIYEKMAE